MIKHFILFLFLLGLNWELYAETKCEESFLIQDKYDDACVDLKVRYYSAEEAIQQCTFRVNPTSCEKVILVDAVLDKQCYAFAFKHYEEEKVTELCTLHSYRCKL